MTARAAGPVGSATSEPATGRDGSLGGRIRDRLRGVHRGDRPPARKPFPGASHLRVAMSTLLTALCLVTCAAAILLLLLWQQSRDAGLLTSQVDRTRNLIATMQDVERWIAFGLVPVAVAWIALAAVNVGRASGQRRNAVVAALSLPVALMAVWYVGGELVAGSDNAIVQGAGWAVQVALLALPLVALERIAMAAEARRRPLRATYLIGAGYLAQLQFVAALSTINVADADDGDWGRLGAYLLIAGLIQVLGSLSANEAARAIEDGTEHRYELRSRFSESLLAQAERS